MLCFFFGKVSVGESWVSSQYHWELNPRQPCKHHNLPLSQIDMVRQPTFILDIGQTITRNDSPKYYMSAQEVSLTKPTNHVRAQDISM